MSIPIGAVRKRQSDSASWKPAGSPKSQRTEWWQESSDWGDAKWSNDEWYGSDSWSTLDKMWAEPDDGRPRGGGGSPSCGSGWGPGGIRGGDVADIKQWQECSKVGSPLPGTWLVPVKTPFEGELQQKAVRAGLISEADAFSKADLLRICKAKGTPLGMVIDLVNTDKYYKGFTDADGVEYHKYPIPGRQVPSIKDVKHVFGIIDDYLKRRPKPNLYVGMHCTHGVNRTGFFATAYMLTRTPEGRQMSSEEAVAAFQEARGVQMDKAYLVDTLKEIVSARPKK